MVSCNGYLFGTANTSVRIVDEEVCREFVARAVAKTARSFPTMIYILM